MAEGVLTVPRALVVAERSADRARPGPRAGDTVQTVPDSSASPSPSLKGLSPSPGSTSSRAGGAGHLARMQLWTLEMLKR